MHNISDCTRCPHLNELYVGREGWGNCLIYSRHGLLKIASSNWRMLTGLEPLGIFEIVLIMTATQLDRQLLACLHLALFGMERGLLMSARGGQRRPRPCGGDFRK